MKQYWQGLKSQEAGERGRGYLTLHCHHQSDVCIKMDNDMRAILLCFISFVGGRQHKITRKQSLTCKGTDLRKTCIGPIQLVDKIKIKLKIWDVVLTRAVDFISS